MYDENISDFFFKNELLSGGNTFFMIDHLFYLKLFDIENIVQGKKASTQLKSRKAPFSFLHNMQISKIFSIKLNSIVGQIYQKYFIQSLCPVFFIKFLFFTK